MAKVHEEEIMKILNDFKTVPVSVMENHVKQYFGMTQNLAYETVFNASKPNRRICFKEEKNGVMFLKQRQELPITERSFSIGAAVRLADEFVDAEDPLKAQGFFVPSFPWLLGTIKNSKCIYICHIQPTQELLVCNAISNRNMDEDMRAITQRIAIIDDNTNVDLIKRIGFSHFCKVSADFSTVEIVQEFSREEAWVDL